jgi:Rieske Fe-S protein
MTNHRENRRRFFKACLSTATVVATNPSLLAMAGTAARSYNRVMLTRQDDRPFTSQDLATGEFFIFNYPFVTTPCFLIDIGSPVEHKEFLQTASQESYNWPGGVGPNNSVVAFSAICAHKLSYPTRSTSFINFRPEEITYTNRNDETVQQKQLIYCCSERSVYDPAKGAEVLGGPARQPLTTIIIEHQRETDQYYATATLGGELYDRFFDSFEFRIALEHKNNDIRKLTENFAAVYKPEYFTNNQVRC